MKINEVTHDKKFEQVMDKLSRQCSEAISSYTQTHKLLYRGIRGMTIDSFISDPPVNRRAKNSPKGFNERIDLILSQHGFEALRSNSIFCSSDYPVTRLYGNPYIIFPFNGFEFTYSEKFYDIYEELSSFNKRGVLHVFDIPDDEFINEFGFKNTNFAHALTSKNEIYIHGKYIALSSEYMDQIKEYLGF